MTITTKRRIRLGMVGGGQGSFIGAVHRIASRIDDRYELVAGALTSDPERSRISAEELFIDPDRAYGSFEEMAIAESKREDGIDVVSIVTPNHVHFAAAKAFLQAGIHVICDKPLTINMEDALELEALVKKSGLVFSLTHNYTGYPMVRQAREMVQSGALGKLRVIQVEYPQDWLATSEENTDNKQAQWRTDPARSGPGGSIGDIGTHAYNLVRFITQEETSEIAADLHTFVEGRQLDDNAHIMLRFKSGARGMLWSSQVSPGNENGLRIRIYGEKGGLEWAQENPNGMSFSALGSPVQILTRGGFGATPAATSVSRIPGGHPEGYLEAFAQIYTETADLILNHPNQESSRLVPSVADGVDGVRFISKAVESHQKGGNWIDF